MQAHRAAGLWSKSSQSLQPSPSELSSQSSLSSQVRARAPYAAVQALVRQRLTRRPSQASQPSMEPSPAAPPNTSAPVRRTSFCSLTAVPQADGLSGDALEEASFQGAIQRFERLAQDRSHFGRRSLDQLEQCLAQLDQYQAYLRRRQLHQGLALTRLKRAEPYLMATTILKDEPGIDNKNGMPVRWDQITGAEMLMAPPGPNHPLDADASIRRFLAAKETRLVYLRRCLHEEAEQVVTVNLAEHSESDEKTVWAERVRALCIEIDVLECYFDLVDLVRKHLCARAARTRMVTILQKLSLGA
jgi:hypothetical protein